MNHSTGEIKGVMARGPGAIGRSAPIVFMLIVTGLIVMGCLVKYPEIIKCRCFLLQKNPDGCSAIVQFDPGAERRRDVMKGQFLSFQLDKYPYREFGLLTAQIRSNPLLNLAGKDSATVFFTKGMVTDRGKKISTVDSLMSGAVIIITDRNLLQRLFCQQSIKSITNVGQ